MTEASKESGKDRWSSNAYQSAASFVPQLTTKVTKLLDPQPGEHILDIGCGDGFLTNQLADIVGSNGSILGLDASPSMISTASEGGRANCIFHVQDCVKPSYDAAGQNKWDKVFSNAAMHWIMRKPETRDNVLSAAFAALKPGGTFVFEMGGFGNVASVHTALIAALVMQGIPPAEAREATPWFFPSDEWMRSKLTEIGFGVEVCELEYRSTKMTPKDASGSGGLEGWVKLMGAQFLEKLDGEPAREAAIKMVCELLESSVTRDEDGTQWLDYVRLRAKATKPMAST